MHVEGRGGPVNTEVEAADKLVETLDKLIVNKNHLPGKMCNVDETSLIVKWKPKGIFMHKEDKSMPGFKLLIKG